VNGLQFLTLAPVLSKSGLCGKCRVFTFEIGFLGMLRNRVWRSSRFFCFKKNKDAKRGRSNTIGHSAHQLSKDALCASKEALLAEKSAFPWKREATITRLDRCSSALAEHVE